jgi:hypothetical protein
MCPDSLAAGVVVGIVVAVAWRHVEEWRDRRRDDALEILREDDDA